MTAVLLDGLTGNGYCVVDDVLAADETAALRTRLDEVAARERANGSAWWSHGNQKVFNLLNRGPEFVALAEHPVGLRVVESLLGPDPLLSSMTANITRPGNEPQQLHADQEYVHEPWQHCLTVQLAWMLDDFTPENGATRVVPGSHLWGVKPHGVGPHGDEPPSVRMTGRAGGFGVIDGRVWHGSSAHTGAPGPRRGIFAYYCVPYLRQQENAHLSLRPEVRRSLTPRMRALLGYDVWYGLGVVDGIPRAWLGTPQRSGPIPGLCL